jgi:hypothetical protein
MPRELNGTTATPVARGHQTVLNGSLPHRSGLDRDFPIDPGTHLAVPGRAPSLPGVVQTDSGWRSPSAPQTYTGQSGAAIFRHGQPDAPVGNTSARSNYAPSGEHPAAAGPAYPAGQPRPAYSPDEATRPSFPGAGAMDRHTYQRPAYTPNRTQPPAYTAPPRYTPPPMPRYAPPPPPPAPRAVPAPSRGR